MKKKTTPLAKQGQYGKLTAKEKARIDKDFDGMAALFSDDDAARNAAKKRREAEYTPPPIQTELDILLERLNQLPIDEHDHDLAGKVMRFFDEVGGGKPTIDLVYRALLFGAMLGGNPITAPTMESFVADFSRRFDQIEKNTHPDAIAKGARRGFFMAKTGTKPYPGREPLCKESKMKEYCARMWHLLNRKHDPKKNQKGAALDIIDKYQYRGAWQTLATHYRSYPPKELEAIWTNMQGRGENTE